MCAVVHFQRCMPFGAGGGAAVVAAGACVEPPQNDRGAKRAGRRRALAPWAPQPSLEASISPRALRGALALAGLLAVGSRRPAACRRAGPTMELIPPPVSESSEDGRPLDSEEEPTWKRKIRQSWYADDVVSVARIVMAVAVGKEATEVHRVLAQEAVISNHNRFTRMLRAFRRGNVSPHHAVELFRLVEVWFRNMLPNVNAWNGVIYAFVLAGRMEEALDLVRAMERGEDRRLPLPDLKTYGSLLLGLAEARGATAAGSILARMTLRGLEPDAVIYNMMVLACIRMTPPDIDSARFWLRKGEERLQREGGPAKLIRGLRQPVALYNALMTGYAKMGRIMDTFAVLGSMRCRGIRPDSYTFHILMNMCMKNSTSGVEECRQLLRLMQQMHVEPSAENYNMLISGYGSSGQLTSALRVANRMREAGIPWSSYTYFHLIGAVIAAGQVELSLRLLAKMRKDGVRPLEMHYCLAFVGLARASFYEDAGRVFRRMASVKDLTDPVAYNMMVGIYCQQRDMESALELRELMEVRGIGPNAMTYRILLEGYTLQQQWQDVLALEGPFLELRERVEKAAVDPTANVADRARAKVALEDPREVNNWKKAYYSLIDAAVWGGQWSRGVLLLEDMVERGLPMDPRKHFRLLADAKPSVRNAQGPMEELLARGRRQAVGALEEEEQQLREAQMRWLRRTPNLVAPGALPQLPSTKAPVVQVPPNLFCASFSPDWLSGTEGAEGARATKPSRSITEVLEFCLGGGTPSAEEAYRVVHDYHHATVHRRAVATVNLPFGRYVIGRTAPETLESLQQLFDKFGRPGAPASPVYVFLRPAAASLDAHLALLAAAAATPDDVLLLRGPEEPAVVDGLTEECRERGDRSLGYALAASLAGMPAAALVNNGLLIAFDNTFEQVAPQEFEASLLSVLGNSMLSSRLGAAAPEAPGTVSGNDSQLAWASWLSRQRLRQLVRCVPDGGVRLDGALHQPAASKAYFFKVRTLRNNQVAVDLWVEDEGATVEFT